MSDVKRYFPDYDGNMQEFANGDFVSAADYDALLADNQRLQRDDEVHWKTRRTLLADIKRLQRAVDEARELMEHCVVQFERKYEDRWDAWLAHNSLPDSGEGQ